MPVDEVIERAEGIWYRLRASSWTDLAETCPWVLSASHTCTLAGDSIIGMGWTFHCIRTAQRVEL